MRPDVQAALDEVLTGDVSVLRWFGVHKSYDVSGLDLSALLLPDRSDPASVAAPRYVEVDIGEKEPRRCLQNGLWLLDAGSVRLALLLATCDEMRGCPRLRVQVAAPSGPEADIRVRELLRRFEASVLASRSYRGKVLSLEVTSPFAGTGGGISVHRLRTVRREDVVLPRRTIDLLERNVLGFCRTRARLRELGLPTKKGLLFYGPPGTGKTHTVHYLAGAMPDHTTLLVTAEQVMLLDEYMALARLLQPSLVVIEDVDLVAESRERMLHPHQPIILHQLLNEMDGLRADADVLFVLTTNRPESLEKALASRPGRIDQAIEFPLPDDEGRRKLVRLYGGGLALADGAEEAIVRRTDGVSGAFLKELMRRTAQLVVERGGGATATLADVDGALEELLVAGGSLNRALLGAPEGPQRP
jgi:hypothetical protein